MHLQNNNDGDSCYNYFKSLLSNSAVVQTGVPGDTAPPRLSSAFVDWSADDNICPSFGDFIFLRTERCTDFGSFSSSRVRFKFDGVNRTTGGCSMINSSVSSVAIALLLRPQLAIVCKVVSDALK
jgi:hypothetical protein